MRTRIIATVGPACAGPATLRAMIREGVSVFRFNFSHGTLEDHERLLALVRRAHRGSRRPIGIMQDLAGHRVRTGRLPRGRPVALREGQRFALTRGTAFVSGRRRRSRKAARARSSRSDSAGHPRSRSSAGE